MTGGTIQMAQIENTQNIINEKNNMAKRSYIRLLLDFGGNIEIFCEEKIRKDKIDFT